MVMPETQDRSESAAVVSYRRDAVPLGPFADEPLELWSMIVLRPDGDWRPERERVAASVAWLLGALDDAGVVLSEYDCASAWLLLPECGIPTVQVVAGWIARAHPQEGAAAPDHRRGSVGLLLDALDEADVVLGAHDRDVVGFLVEDCGPPAARAVAGWLRRVGERLHTPRG